MGEAAAAVKAGNTPGPIRIAITALGRSAVFELTAMPPGPALTPENFVNAASYEPGVAFGGIVAIVGPGLTAGLDLTPGTCVTSGDPWQRLPFRVAGTEVQFSSRMAPILSVCRGKDGIDQVNVQAPFELAPATIGVAIRTGVGTSGASEILVESVQVLAAHPGLFEQTAGEVRIALAQRPDASFVSPTNPARRGERIRVFATGLGPVLPTAQTNQPGIPGQVPFFRPEILVGGIAVAAEAEYAASTIGVFTVDFVVPDDATAGPGIPLLLSMFEGDIAYRSKVTHISIE
jgi:uncharacterized protein (TIGR03437 family)